MLDAAGVNYLSAQSCDEMNTSVEDSLHYLKINNRLLVDGLFYRTSMDDNNSKHTPQENTSGQAFIMTPPPPPGQTCKCPPLLDNFIYIF